MGNIPAKQYAIIFLFLLVFGAIFVACFSPFAGENAGIENGSGTVVFNLSESSLPRVLVNVDGGEHLAFSHRVTFRRPNTNAWGPGGSGGVEISLNSENRIDVPVGDWIISVRAFGNRPATGSYSAFPATMLRAFGVPGPGAANSSGYLMPNDNGSVSISHGENRVSILMRTAFEVSTGAQLGAVAGNLDVSGQNEIAIISGSILISSNITIPINGSLTLITDGLQGVIQKDGADFSIFQVNGELSLGCEYIKRDGPIIEGVSETESSLINLSSGNLFMHRGTILRGNTSLLSNGGAVSVNGGWFLMLGGDISNNAAPYGGGVYVNGSGTFTMSGGTIRGNYADEHGGGVFVVQGGTFTKSDGGIIYGSDLLADASIPGSIIERPSNQGNDNIAGKGISIHYSIGYGHAVYANTFTDPILIDSTLGPGDGFPPLP
jgi:hypothetical protein